MTMRDKIADICDEEIQSDDPSCYVLADAILAALPDMIPDLVWVETHNNLVLTSSMDGRYYSLEWFMVGSGEGWRCTYYVNGKLEPSQILSENSRCSLLQAQSAANAHHRAAIMAAFKGEKT